MKADLLLFGRITSGPFFALLVKEQSANRQSALPNPQSSIRTPDRQSTIDDPQ
jgi:hypothetical protein